MGTIIWETPNLYNFSESGSIFWSIDISRYTVLLTIIANCVVLAIERPQPNGDKTELAKQLVSPCTLSHISQQLRKRRSHSAWLLPLTDASSSRLKLLEMLVLIGCLLSIRSPPSPISSAFSPSRRAWKSWRRDSYYILGVTWEICGTLWTL